jgi:sugar lactone lactonase YvrE
VGFVLLVTTTSGLPPNLWDPLTPQRTAIAASGGLSPALAITSTGVLVLDTRNGDVIEIDPHTGAHRDVLHIAGFPTALAVGGGAAWVVDARSGTVARLTGR